MRDVGLVAQMLRSSDPHQQQAMLLVQAAKTAVWTRRAVFTALVAVPVNGLVTFLVTYLVSRS